MSNALVSIITPTYNCAKFIGKTIESVLKQTYTNWEIVIVDDASTDNTEEIVKQYNDKRIKYIKLKQNSGADVARNIAIEEAKGKYMAFLDSDDLWQPDKLEKQIKFMEQNNYNITATDYEQIDEEGRILNRIIKAKEKVDYNSMLLSNSVGNSTIMYNVENIGKFKVPNIKKRNDYALWLQMLKKEKYIYGIPEILMQYRVRSNSISRNKLNLIKYQWQLYREIEKLSVFRSMFHICWWGIVKSLKKR